VRQKLPPSISSSLVLLVFDDNRLRDYQRDHSSRWIKASWNDDLIDRIDRVVGSPLNVVLTFQSSAKRALSQCAPLFIDKWC